MSRSQNSEEKYHKSKHYAGYHVSRDTIFHNLELYTRGVTIPSSSNSNITQAAADQIIIPTLEGYVLPLLPAAPMSIHNIHLKCRALTEAREYYDELQYPIYKRNVGKYNIKEIDQIKTRYVFYPSGTIDVSTSNSDNPIKIETESDRLGLLAFFEKIKNNTPARLLVPEIHRWELTECDINKDIKVSDLVHFAGTKIQVKHMDHLFRIYIKKIENNTFCRIEETKFMKSTVIDSINYLFNPHERTEKLLAEIKTMLKQI